MTERTARAGDYTMALDNRREMHADAEARGHKVTWKRGRSGDKPGDWFHGECSNCGGNMKVGPTWSSSTVAHPSRDIRHSTCQGPGTAWQHDMQNELAHERMQRAVSDFGQAVKDNYDREWLRGQGIEASRKGGAMERVAVLLGGDRRPITGPDGRQYLVPLGADGLRRTAHVSGNQEDVLHCPFVVRET